MQITKDIDTIYDDLLTNHFNRRGVDAGPLLCAFYSGVALCSWCLYRIGQYVSEQILPTSADSEWIEKHAKIRGISKLPYETDSELLARIMDDIQYPRAGGNKYDWPRWAKDVSHTHNPGSSNEWIESVSMAITDENARGAGTINLVITSDNPISSPPEQATSDLIDDVTDYIETKRPLGIWDYMVIGAEPLLVNVLMSVQADDFSAISGTIQTQIENLIKSKLPGEPLYRSQLSSIAIECGADDATVTVPSSTIIPDNGPTSYERLWPGTITVVEA